MPRKEKTEEQKNTLSSFNQETADHLKKFMRSRAMTVEVKAKAVTLSTTIVGRPVIFAAFRSPANRKADVRLYGYIPGETSLPKVLQAAVVDEGQNGWFMKGESDPNVTAQGIFLHLKDVEARVKDYAKKHKVKAGQKPRRTWGIAGIPLSYFKD